MAKPISFGKLDFKIVASMDETHRAPEAETPFRICILGDFSGRENRGVMDSVSAIKEQRLIQVDRDNIEDVMEGLGVELNLSVAGKENIPVTVRFAEMDDFHPEQLFARLEVFQTLRDTRKRLNDTRTFEAAKKEVRSWIGREATSEHSEPASKKASPKPTVSGKTSGSLLDQIIGETGARLPDEGELATPSGWDAFLQEIVGPHLVAGDDPEQAQLVAAVDASVSGLMEKILHHPHFQAEAAWRALRLLVYKAETDAKLKVCLLDLSKDELVADLSASEDLQSTEIYRLFVEQAKGTLGGERWAFLAGNYIFDQTLEDAQLLGRMAKIMSLAGVPFVAAAHPHILGCESLADKPHPDDWERSIDSEETQAWQALRGLPEARYLGLAIPRFLLRLPFGEDTDPVDYFDFEEMPKGPVHENYLWGNPTFACALLLAQAFSHYGWDLRPGMIQDIQGLPLHVYKEQGDSVIKPCAEVLLTEKAMEKILELGLMPLLSFKNQDSIRLARFQSVADPLTPLAGPWKL